MRLVLEAEGLELDAWLRDYMRSTVVFAIWHHELKIKGIAIRLDGVPDRRGEPAVRCSLRVETPERGALCSEAIGRDVCEAVQVAADQLEVSLYRWASVAEPMAPERLAA